MNPDFKKLSFNPLMRSEEVVRYSGVYQSQPETLSVHIADVSMMSYIIAQTLNSFGENLNIGILLEKCLIHDLDETLTGDIPRNTKYANPKIKADLDELQDEVLEKILKYIPNDDIIDKCKNAKQGKEGLILTLSDMLGVARRALQEVDLRGNRTFLKVVEELGYHLDKLKTKVDVEEFLPASRDWIMNLIDDTIKTIHKLHSENYKYIDEYQISDNVFIGRS